MAVSLIASALLLDIFGCAVPLTWMEDARAFKVGVFLLWMALMGISILMGSLYPRELEGVNPLLKVGLESICLSCAIYPVHGFASNMTPYGTAQANTVACLALIDLFVTAVGYISLLVGTIWFIFF